MYKLFLGLLTVSSPIWAHSSRPVSPALTQHIQSIVNKRPDTLEVDLWAAPQGEYIQVARIVASKNSFSAGDIPVPSGANPYASLRLFKNREYIGDITTVDNQYVIRPYKTSSAWSLMLLAKKCNGSLVFTFENTTRTNH